ncbi:MAG: cytochrome c oxidase subunit 3 [Tepidisphaeraceae bacterium]
MSDAAATPHAHDDGHGHGHNPHLAHHFDTMEQQYDSSKLGMWVFLATELLMFGGLFCAYAVYRANHPEVFLYAHTYLNTTWGAINTGILLASSLTMAWAVRASQLGQQKALVTLLLVTLLGGAGFMMIKAVEYQHKFHEYLAPGYYNQYNVHFKGPADEGMANPEGLKKEKAEIAAAAAPAITPAGMASTPDKPFLYEDPHAGGADAAKIVPHYTANNTLVAEQTYAKSEEAGHAEAAHEGEHGGMTYVDIGSQLSQQRVNTFFGIYYCMTGLHGVHVIVGMGLIFWVTWRAGSKRVKAWIPPLPVIAIGALPRLHRRHQPPQRLHHRRHPVPADRRPLARDPRARRRQAQPRSQRPRRIQRKLLRPRRPRRPLLALGRPDLDLPLPAAVPDPREGGVVRNGVDSR